MANSTPTLLHGDWRGPNTPSPSPGLGSVNSSSVAASSLLAPPTMREGACSNIETATLRQALSQLAQSVRAQLSQLQITQPLRLELSPDPGESKFIKTKINRQAITAIVSLRCLREAGQSVHSFESLVSTLVIWASARHFYFHHLRSRSLRRIFTGLVGLLTLSAVGLSLLGPIFPAIFILLGFIGVGVLGRDLLDFSVSWKRSNLAYVRQLLSILDHETIQTLILPHDSLAKDAYHILARHRERISQVQSEATIIQQIQRVEV